MISTFTKLCNAQLNCYASILLSVAVLSTTAGRAAEPHPNVGNSDLAGHFSGQVLGPDGKPFDGAKVRVVPISNDLSDKIVPADQLEPAAGQATTGVDGRFDIFTSEVTLLDIDGLPTNRFCLVIATADGYGPDWVQILGRNPRNGGPMPATDLKLQLVSDEVAIDGRLLGPDGKPLAAARVQVTNLMIPKNNDLDAHIWRAIDHQRAQQKNRHIPFFVTPSYEKYLSFPQILPTPTTVLTDGQGRFILTGLGSDRLVQLKVSTPDIVDSYISAVTRELPDASQKSDKQDSVEYTEYLRKMGARFTRQLEPGRTISGVVLDIKTRQPIPGMLVGTGREGYPRSGISGYRTTTDSNGLFHVTGLDPQSEQLAITAVSPPGMTYQSASALSVDDSPIEILCEPGIPFRLKLTNEQGQPIDAEVDYFEVRPNPYAPKLYCFPSFNPISETLKGPDGTYTGFALPGPGVVLVKTPADSNYLPPAVDPQAFFAPDKPSVRSNTAFLDYGDRDRINTVMGMVPQNNFAAIVLVNPTPNSSHLELSATVRKGTPRFVTLSDPQGRPIIGVKTNGVTSHGREPPLRSATFPLLRLHPDRATRILFRHEDRQLAGYLVARGDGDSTYAVTMRRWAKVTGRLVDGSGNPLPLRQKDTIWERALNVKASLPDDPDYRHAQYAEVDRAGRFTLDKIIPGHSYEGTIYQNQGKFRYSAFTDLILEPGETRDLGDIRLAVHTLAHATTVSERLSASTRKDLRQTLPVAWFGGLAHDSPAARLPLVTRVTVDGR